MLCRVTSNLYGDPSAMKLDSVSFEPGGLGRTSFARPRKLLTASETLAARTAGTLTAEAHAGLIARVVGVLQSGLR